MVNKNVMDKLLASIQKPLIYLACPYRHTDDHDQTWERVNFVAAALIRQGNIVFSPISMSHGIDSHIPGDTTFETYRELDEFFLRRSDILAVLKLDGWDISTGVFHEIDLANKLGKPIIFLPDPWRE